MSHRIHAACGAPVNLAERAAATTKVIERFRHKPFDWRGNATCIHLAQAQMRALGHRPPRIPKFHTALGAQRALQATGFADLGALLDSMLPVIPPAMMWTGDLALLDGEPPFDAIVINVGGKVMGYHEEVPGLAPMIPLAIKRAWRL